MPRTKPRLPTKQGHLIEDQLLDDAARAQVLNDLSLGGMNELLAATLLVAVEAQASYIASLPKQPTIGESSAAFSLAAKEAHAFAETLTALKGASSLVRARFENVHGRGSLAKFDKQLRDLRSLLRKFAKEPDQAYVQVKPAYLLIHFFVQDFKRITGELPSNTANLMDSDKHIPSPFVTCIRVGMYLMERKWRTPEAVTQLIARNS